MMKILLGEGERLQYWWYGLAYRKRDACVGVFYPVPLNYIVRAWRNACWAWDRHRSTPSWSDEQLRAEYTRGYNHGWKAGERMFGDRLEIIAARVKQLDELNRESDDETQVDQEDRG